jgi:DNA-binding transcriptional ArsR family regulator
MDDNDDRKDIKLEAHQILWTYPDEGGDGEEALRYTVRHPFVREEKCARCKWFPCLCTSSTRNRNEPACFECKLCKRKGMSESAARHHLKEPMHEKRMEQVSEQRDDVMEVVSGWLHIHDEPSMKRLKRDDVEDLPDKLLAEVFRYITNLEFPNESYSLANAKELMIKHENMERLTLLHLAVWKAQCLVNMPDSYNSFFAAQEWMANGWKASKAHGRKSGAMHTVVSLVLPFL